MCIDILLCWLNVFRILHRTIRFGTQWLTVRELFESLPQPASYKNWFIQELNSTLVILIDLQWLILLWQWERLRTENTDLIVSLQSFLLRETQRSKINTAYKLHQSKLTGNNSLHVKHSHKKRYAVKLYLKNANVHVFGEHHDVQRTAENHSHPQHLSYHFKRRDFKS